MKSVLSLDVTPSAFERSFKAATKLRRELPTDRDGKYTTYVAFAFS